MVNTNPNEKKPLYLDLKERGLLPKKKYNFQ